MFITLSDKALITEYSNQNVFNLKGISMSWKKNMKALFMDDLKERRKKSIISFLISLKHI